MSFHIKYNPLFRVVFRTVSDGVIPSKWLRNTELFPTIECQRLLKKYQLIARTRPHGIEVYFKSVFEPPTTDPIIEQEILELVKFRFLYLKRVFPIDRAINDKSVKHFKVDNLDTSEMIKKVDASIVADEFALSGSDSFSILSSDALFAIKPFGVVDIYWEDKQEIANNEFINYWIDLEKKELPPPPPDDE